MEQDGGPKTTINGDKSQVDQVWYLRNLFLVMVLNMTWQLAIVVVVPLVGGHWLDERYGTGPIWFLVGCGVALLGIIGVMVRIVRIAGRKANAALTESKK